MREPSASLMLHIGPLRPESLYLIQQFSSPVLAVCPPCSNSSNISLPNNVRHATAWVTSQGNEQTCYHYSLNDFSSLVEGIGLKEIYPGVRLELSKTVETRSILDVLAEHCVESKRLTALVIEQVDQAMPLLKELKTQGLLDNLSYLWVRTSPICLYQGMPSQQELNEWCEEEGFEPIKEESEDPEFWLQAFKRNRLHDMLNKTREQSIEQAKKLETVTLEREEIRKKLNATQKEVLRVKDEREALRKEAQELKQKNQQMVSEVSETQQKQHLLEIELERAEAQLELIKELLLKDQLLSS